jgi:hypothetical protein
MRAYTGGTGAEVCGGGGVGLRCDARLLPTCRDESAMGSPTVEEEGRRARASHVAVWGARVGIGRALGLTFSCGMAVTRRALSTSVSCLFLLRSFRSCRCCCRRARPARLSLDLSSTSGSCAWRGATRVQGGTQGKVRVYSYMLI